MPTHGTPKSQIQDESQTQGVDFPKQWLGICQEEAKTWRVHKGWVGYYHLANMKRFLMETDEWLRRRLRMCIWKSWKRVKTRIANLIKCGIDKYQAYMWGNSRLGDWRIAGSYILCRAITNESWAWQAMLHWWVHTSNGTQNRNRRMRNRMYGGVRGRKTKVGEKLLRFPPTRLSYLYGWFWL